MVLLIGRIIDPLLVDEYPRWLEKAYAIFREMVEGSNEVARFRWSELQQLEATLQGISHDESWDPQNAPSGQSGTVSQLLFPATSYLPTSMSQSSSSDVHFIADNNLDVGCGLGPMLNTAEMMAMANSIETYDADWVSSAMIDHNLW